MRMNEYQKKAKEFAEYKEYYHPLLYPIIGLANESGELLGKFKKLIRDDNLILTEERRQSMIDESSDVLWYLAAVADALGTTLEDIAIHNIDKLTDRKKRGVIKGSGDNR